MASADSQTVTRLLHAVRAGDPAAFDELFGLVYGELHALAVGQRRRWRGDRTLNTTALVHEAYLRLADHPSPEWRSRSHFLAVASRAMRQVLLDYAKRRRAAKRGGGRARISLHEIEATLGGDGDPGDAWPEAVIALEASLRRLERHDARQSRIVECRFFAGMTIRETAEALGVSPATVKRGWSMARAWLYRDLERELGGTA